MTRHIRLSLDEFCAAAREVVDELPEQFQHWLDNVVVDVELAPTAEMLAELGMEPDETLMGLFEGLSITERDYGDPPPRLGNRILLFKRPIESQCRSRDEVKYEIRRTMLHELAHHFGYSEEDLDAFESQPSPFDEDDD